MRNQEPPASDLDLAQPTPIDLPNVNVQIDPQPGDEGGPYRVVALEQHASRSTLYPLRLQVRPSPDYITHSYFESASKVRHVFAFDDRTFWQRANPKLLVQSLREGAGQLGVDGTDRGGCDPAVGWPTYGVNLTDARKRRRTSSRLSFGRIPGSRSIRGGLASDLAGCAQVALKFLNLDERQGLKEFRAIQRFKTIRYPHLAAVTALWLLDEAGTVLEDTATGAYDVPLPTGRDTLWPDPKKRGIRHVPHRLVVATLLCDKNLMDRLAECQAQGSAGVPVDELLRYMEEAAKAIDFLNSAQCHDLGDGPVAIQHCDIKPANMMFLPAGWS